jgi:hypothetical protein
MAKRSNHQSFVQKKDHHSNDKQTGDIQKKPPYIRVAGKIIVMTQPEPAYLLISEAVTVRADRLFHGKAQTASFALSGKSYSYRKLHK